MYFLTHIEPLHPRKGKEALVVIREQDQEKRVFHSHNVVIEVPHPFVSQHLAPDEAETLRQRLQQDPQYSHVDFWKIHLNQYRTVLQARGSKEDRLILPDEFICKRSTTDKRDPFGWNSPSRMLRWYYPPLLVIDDPKNIPLPDQQKKNRYASIDEVVNDTFATMDIEVEGWETGKEQIVMIAYLSSQRKVLLHHFPFSELFIEDFCLQYVPDQQTFGEQLTALIKKDDPLWIEGHNIMQYDALKLREITRAYFPATNEYHPITKASQGLKRVITKGRFTLDTYPYSQNYLRIFHDQKLETLSGFTKALDYAEQATLIKKAQQGDRNAFHQLVAYALTDVRQTHQLAESLKENLVRQSRLFRRDPDSTCTTSKIEVAENYWNRRYFLRKGTFPYKRYGQQHPINLHEWKLRLLHQDWQRGFFEHVHVVQVTPFLAAFSPWFTGEAREVLAQLKRERQPALQLGLAETLTAYLNKPVGECEEILRRENMHLGQPVAGLSAKQRQAFAAVRKGYALPAADPRELVNHFAEVVRDTNLALQVHQVMNYSQYFFLLHGDIQVNKLEEKLLGLYVGTGAALSLTREVFITNPFSESDQRRFIYQGIHPSAGKKSSWERWLMNELIRRIFAGEPDRHIHHFLDEHLTAYLSGTLPLEEYLISTRTDTYYREEISTILARSEVQNRELSLQWEREKKKVHQHPQPDVKQFLKNFLHEIDKEYCGPVIREYLEYLLHPYPPQVTWGYDNGMEMRVPLFQHPDREMYQQKLFSHFKDFFRVLGYQP